MSSPLREKQTEAAPIPERAFVDRFLAFVAGLLGAPSIEGDLDPTAADYLNKRLQRHKVTLRRAQLFRRLFILAAIIFLITWALVNYRWYLHSPWSFDTSDVVTLSCISFFLSTAFGINVRQARQDVDDILGEIDLKNIALDEREKRAQKLFQLHQRELKRYYDQSLNQGLWIFLAGIICLILGFVVIGITLYEVFSNSISNNDKIVIGVVGAVSGMLINFIAAIYMRMFGDTVKSATEFHNRLVATHHLHFGNFLISKIDDNKLRDTALAEVSRAIAKERVPDAKQVDSRSKKGGTLSKEKEEN